MTIPRTIPYWGLALILALAVALSLWPVPTTFDVTARSESLSLVADSERWWTWYLNEVEVLYDTRPGTGPSEYSSEGFETFTGSLLLAPKTEVDIDRIGLGPLRIRCRAQDPEDVVAVAQSDGGELLKKFSDRIVVRLADPREWAEAGRVLVLPIVGDFELGNRLTRNTGRNPGLLRTGSIRLLGHTLVGGSRFDGGSVSLDLGDSVHIDADPGEPPVGLLVVDDRPGLEVALRGIGWKAVVSRFESQGYDVELPLGTRISHDPVVASTWAFFLFLAGLIAVVRQRSIDRNAP